MTEFMRYAACHTIQYDWCGNGLVMVWGIPNELHCARLSAQVPLKAVRNVYMRSLLQRALSLFPHIKEKLWFGGWVDNLLQLCPALLVWHLLRTFETAGKHSKPYTSTYWYEHEHAIRAGLPMHLERAAGTASCHKWHEANERNISQEGTWREQ